MNKFLLAAFLCTLVFVSILSSCKKDVEKKQVMYEITKSVSGFKVTYLDENNDLITQNIVTNSAEDIWRYSFEETPRNVVYVSASYKDINSAIQVKVFVDGKVYKQASTKYDTTMFVTVSGVVP
ncbi:MAG: hypothetical protein PHT69_12235 [Bacteroidales bacterium]|nr:hypothetical protein [Bacteroidales bacterium]